MTNKPIVHTLALLTLALALTGCATSTEGLSKEQITRQQVNNERWAEFGRSVLTVAVNAGVTSFGNRGRESGFAK